MLEKVSVATNVSDRLSDAEMSETVNVIVLESDSCCVGELECELLLERATEGVAERVGVRGGVRVGETVCVSCCEKE